MNEIPISWIFFLGIFQANLSFFNQIARTAEYFYIDLKEKDFLKDPVTLTSPCVGNLAG